MQNKIWRLEVLKDEVQQLQLCLALYFLFQNLQRYQKLNHLLLSAQFGWLWSECEWAFGSLLKSKLFVSQI